MPVLLVHTPMWGGGLETERAALLPGWELTTDRACLHDAAAVVFHLPQLDLRWFFRVAKPPGQLWVGWTMEPNAFYPHQDAEPLRRRLDVMMSPDLDSDVPVPYVGPYWRELMDPDPPPGRDPARRPVAAIISSTHDQSGRLAYLEELMRHVAVDSFGAQLNTAGPVPDDDDGARAKVELLRRYRFTLAFENALDGGVVTEKLYQPLVAGSVPVYLGPPVDARLVPGPGCYVDAAAIEPVDLAALLERSTDKEYAEYHRWRGEPPTTKFVSLGALTEVHAFTRLCQLLDERRSARRLEPVHRLEE